MGAALGWGALAASSLLTLVACATVLVTAEVLAIPFYQALRDATRSSLLRAICVRILCDEASHLNYQALTIGLIRRPLPCRNHRGVVGRGEQFGPRLLPGRIVVFPLAVVFHPGDQHHPQRPGLRRRDRGPGQNGVYLRDGPRGRGGGPARP